MTSSDERASSAVSLSCGLFSPTCTSSRTCKARCTHCRADCPRYSRLSPPPPAECWTHAANHRQAEGTSSRVPTQKKSPRFMLCVLMPCGLRDVTYSRCARKYGPRIASARLISRNVTPSATSQDIACRYGRFVMKTSASIALATIAASASARRRAAASAGSWSRVGVRSRICCSYVRSIAE